MWPWKNRTVKIEIGIGEALDRLSILGVKRKKLTGEKKDLVTKELDHLVKVLQKAHILAQSGFVKDSEVEAKYIDLREINLELWEVEDNVRKVCECEECSDEATKECMRLARRVYKLNEYRSKVKAFIDEICGSSIREVKGYKGT